MIAIILLMSMQSGSTAAPAVSFIDTTSVIDWNGGETWTQVLKGLNQTGNVVVDGRAARGQPTTVPTLQIKAGRQTFWKAIDEVCTQAKLHWVNQNGLLELVANEESGTRYIAYDGAWRARLVRRSLIAYEDPSLNRLLCHIELTVEPRLQPLLCSFNPSVKMMPGKSMSSYGSSGTISFDGEASKLLEVRLPMPPRSLAELDNIRVDGTAWLSPGRLKFNLPLAVNPNQTQKGVAFAITSLDVNQASKTWTIDTELEYPSSSLEFESNQARLLSSMKLVLSNGKEQLADMGRDIRTDSGRTVKVRWLFRNVPAPNTQWKAVLTAPATPQKVPVVLIFEKVALP